MTTVVGAVIQPPLSPSLATAIRQHDKNFVKNAVHVRINSFSFPSPPTSGGRRFAVAASRSTKEETNSKSDDQDDLRFLLKLVAGSFAGAAVIKYGSILVPEITRPNIIQALVMISTPVIVAVLVLIKESSVED